MSKEEALATVVVTAVGGSSLPALSLVESVSSFDCEVIGPKDLIH